MDGSFSNQDQDQSWPKPDDRTVSELLILGARGRCPRCGEGSLFTGVLAMADQCNHCDLNLEGSDVGDGAVVPATFILGIVVLAMAVAFDLMVEPPLWVHAIVWAPVLVVGTIVTLRPLKGMLVALQYKFRRVDELPKPGGQ